MAHYHRSRGQQKSKWERFKQRFGMSPSEFRDLKKKEPSIANELRHKAYSLFIRDTKVVKL